LDTEGFAYQYASSSQSPSIMGCHYVSFCIQDGSFEFTDTEPGLGPISAHLLYP